MRFLLRLPLFVILMGIGAAAMLIPAAHAFATDAPRVAQPFLYGAVLFGTLTALVGLACVNYAPVNVSRSHLTTLLAAYCVLPLMLAIPMREAVPDMSLANAYFEMVSSITTTGATLFEIPGRLPDPVHLWRALVGWLGGFLMLVAAISILAPMRLAGFEVLRPATTSEGVESMIQSADPGERVLRFTHHLFPFYVTATAILWLVLSVFGTQPFEGLCLALSTLSTSGILPAPRFDTPPTSVPGEMVIFVFLFFAISRQTFMARYDWHLPERLRTDRELRFAVVFLITVPGFLILRHWLGAFDVNEEANIIAGAEALWGSLFTVMSFLSTTGFVSQDWNAAQAWSGLPTPGLIFAGLAIIGGGVATTAGGVKLLRIYALYKHGTREMGRLVHPNSVGSAGWLGRDVRRRGAVTAWVFFMLFAMSIAGFSVALSATGLRFEASVIFAISALSTTGPLAELALEDGTRYATLTRNAKYILVTAMVLGRLEALAIIALFNPDFWRS